MPLYDFLEQAPPGPEHEPRFRPPHLPDEDAMVPIRGVRREQGLTFAGAGVGPGDRLSKSDPTVKKHPDAFATVVPPGVVRERALVARSTFVVEDDEEGRGRTVYAGTWVDRGDPIVRIHPHIVRPARHRRGGSRSIMSLTKHEHDEFAGRPRPVARIRAGTGKLVLRQSIVAEGETWVAGKERVAPSHPVVARFPHLFEPADATDAATRDLHRALLSRAKRPKSSSVRQPAGGRRRVAADWRLPAAASGRPDWWFSKRCPRASRPVRTS